MPVTRSLAALLAGGLWIGAFAAPASADDAQTSPPVAEVSASKPARASSVPRLQLAVGLSASWQERRDYGNETRSNFVPELVVLGYLKTEVPRLYLRPGARLGYSGLAQAEVPRGITFREDEAIASGEVGVLYDGLFIPSATAGVAMHYRHVGADSNISTVDASSLGGHEVQPMVYGQIGAGLSLASGFIVVEPFLRYEWLRRDPRLGWRYGLEITVQAF